MVLIQKNGGPYTKDEQRKRRNEVYKFHFEYGYSARKISEFLKINRGTINRDVMYWYNQINNKWRRLDPVTQIIQNIERLEIQKTRLREMLDKTLTIQEKLAIEKMILDIENKISNIRIKIAYSQETIDRKLIDRLNEHYKKEGKHFRVIDIKDYFRTSEKAHDKIVNIIKEDRKF